MSSEIALRVENLSKCYQVYNTPRARLKQFILPHLNRIFGRKSYNYFHDFWALRDVSFDVKQGETVGIIGRNGAGKSTLLQIICGTLNPSGGTVETNGRVAALLELGTGFNPEFTGRENVYMNATILGLSNKEIDKRYKDILSFADIGEYIDQPVKTYSSGMILRLAFAVIAHVDADILVIDEALAVGDTIFVQKCMRFIRRFQKTGAILFVSHDINSVINLCQRAIWLHQGQTLQMGISKKVGEAYLQYTQQQVYGEEHRLQSVGNGGSELDVSHAGSDVIDYAGQMQVADHLSEANGWKTGAGEVLAVHLETVAGNRGDIYKGGETVRMVIRAVVFKSMNQPILGFLVRDRLGQDLFGENTLPFTSLNPCPISAGQEIEGEFIFRLPMLPNGNYAVMASLAEGDLYNHIEHHWLHDALIINVFSSKVRWGLVGVPFEKVILRNAS